MAQVVGATLTGSVVRITRTSETEQLPGFSRSDSESAEVRVMVDAGAYDRPYAAIPVQPEQADGIRLGQRVTITFHGEAPDA